MEGFMDLLKEVNIAQIFILLGAGWMFYNRLDEKIEKLDQRLGANIKSLGEKVEDIDRRLCRIEGSLATQGHCLFNKTHEEKKAE